jgi:hypothetical protein
VFEGRSGSADGGGIFGTAMGQIRTLGATYLGFYQAITSITAEINRDRERRRAQFMVGVEADREVANQAPNLGVELLGEMKRWAQQNQGVIGAKTEDILKVAGFTKSMGLDDPDRIKSATADALRLSVGNAERAIGLQQIAVASLVQQGSTDMRGAMVQSRQFAEASAGENEMVFMGNVVDRLITATNDQSDPERAVERGMELIAAASKTFSDTSGDNTSRAIGNIIAALPKVKLQESTMIDGERVQIDKELVDSFNNETDVLKRLDMVLENAAMMQIAVRSSGLGKQVVELATGEKGPLDAMMEDVLTSPKFREELARAEKTIMPLSEASAYFESYAQQIEENTEALRMVNQGLGALAVQTTQKANVLSGGAQEVFDRGMEGIDLTGPDEVPRAVGTTAEELARIEDRKAGRPENEASYKRAGIAAMIEWEKKQGTPEDADNLVQLRVLDREMAKLENAIEKEVGAERFLAERIDTLTDATDKPRAAMVRDSMDLRGDTPDKQARRREFELKEAALEVVKAEKKAAQVKRLTGEDDPELIQEVEQAKARQRILIDRQIRQGRGDQLRREMAEVDRKIASNRSGEFFDRFSEEGAAARQRNLRELEERRVDLSGRIAGAAGEDAADQPIRDLSGGVVGRRAMALQAASVAAVRTAARQAVRAVEVSPDDLLGVRTATEQILEQPGDMIRVQPDDRSGNRGVFLDGSAPVSTLPEQKEQTDLLRQIAAQPLVEVIERQVRVPVTPNVPITSPPQSANGPVGGQVPPVPPTPPAGQRAIPIDPIGDDLLFSLPPEPPRAQAERAEWSDRTKQVADAVDRWTAKMDYEDAASDARRAEIARLDPEIPNDPRETQKIQRLDRMQYDLEKMGEWDTEKQTAAWGELNPENPLGVPDRDSATQKDEALRADYVKAAKAYRDAMASSGNMAEIERTGKEFRRLKSVLKLSFDGPFAYEAIEPDRVRKPPAGLPTDARMPTDIFGDNFRQRDGRQVGIAGSNRLSIATNGAGQQTMNGAAGAVLVTPMSSQKIEELLAQNNALMSELIRIQAMATIKPSRSIGASQAVQRQPVAVAAP